jgi:hypothetical protein
VLRSRPEAREALIAAAGGYDRLVLLGDTVELRHGPLRDVFAVARPVLEELAGGLRDGAEVVIVPGNHDHRLLGGWLAGRAANGVPPPLGLESPVAWREGEPLAQLAAWFAPARVRVAYPGVWLRDDVYAMHGHYADRETTVPILERLGSGLTRRAMARGNGAPGSAEDYEAELAPMYAWIDAVAETGGPGARGVPNLQVRAWRRLVSGDRGVRARAVGLGFSSAVFALNRAGIGPLDSEISATELRRGGLRAVVQVLARLGVPARHVISGHTHRAGPLPGDERSEWTAGTGARLHNTGCWVYDPGFVRDPQSPYRPGFAAVVEDEGEPELVNFLDPA